MAVETELKTSWASALGKVHASAHRRTLSSLSYSLSCPGDAVRKPYRTVNRADQPSKERSATAAVPRRAWATWWSRAPSCCTHLLSRQSWLASPTEGGAE